MGAFPIKCSNKGMNAYWVYAIQQQHEPVLSYTRVACFTTRRAHFSLRPAQLPRSCVGVEFLGFRF